MQMAVQTVILDPCRDLSARRKLVYRLKFCEIDRFSSQPDSMHKKSDKVFRWVDYEEEMPDPKSKKFKSSSLGKVKRKFLRFPFKFKYLKQDLVLEVYSALDTRNKL
jgi:hypothetical protein